MSPGTGTQWDLSILAGLCASLQSRVLCLLHPCQPSSADVERGDYSTLSPLLPPAAGSYLMVNSSQHAPGQRAHLLFQALSENDTHCLQFSYFMYSRDGRSPGTLSAYVRVTGGPLGSAVWNSSGSHGRQWHQAELAVSLFWPSEYQVSPSRTPLAWHGPPCLAWCGFPGNA